MGVRGGAARCRVRHRGSGRLKHAAATAGGGGGAAGAAAAGRVCGSARGERAAWARGGPAVGRGGPVGLGGGAATRQLPSGRGGRAGGGQARAAAAAPVDPAAVAARPHACDVAAFEIELNRGRRRAPPPPELRSLESSQSQESGQWTKFAVDR